MADTNRILRTPEPDFPAATFVEERPEPRFPAPVFDLAPVSAENSEEQQRFNANLIALSSQRILSEPSSIPEIYDTALRTIRSGNEGVTREGLAFITRQKRLAALQEFQALRLTDPSTNQGDLTSLLEEEFELEQSNLSFSSVEQEASYYLFDFARTDPAQAVLSDMLSVRGGNVQAAAYRMQQRMLFANKMDQIQTRLEDRDVWWDISDFLKTIDDFLASFVNPSIVSARDVVPGFTPSLTKLPGRNLENSIRHLWDIGDIDEFSTALDQLGENILENSGWINENLTMAVKNYQLFYGISPQQAIDFNLGGVVDAVNLIILPLSIGRGSLNIFKHMRKAGDPSGASSSATLRITQESSEAVRASAARGTAIVGNHTDAMAEGVPNYILTV